MLEILDGIIATGAVVLGLSLIVQSIQQIMKQMLDLKSKYMRRELLALFGTVDRSRLTDWFSSRLERTFGKPVKWISKSSGSHTKALSRTLSAGLTKISEAVAPAFVEERVVDTTARAIVNELSERVKGFGYKDLELLEDIGKADFKKIVDGLELFNEEDKKGLKKQILTEIDTWFDLSKKAFQQHYERRMKYWSIAISLVVVLVVNANIFEVYHEFAVNKPLRDAAVAMGEHLVADHLDTVKAQVSVEDSSSSAAPVLARQANFGEIKLNIARIETLLNEKTFQAWRWDSLRVARMRLMDTPRDWAIRGLGWLGMTLLVSLGAPFWYDFLKAIMGIKGTLKSKGGTSEGE